MSVSFNSPPRNTTALLDCLCDFVSPATPALTQSGEAKAERERGSTVSCKREQAQEAAGTLLLILTAAAGHHTFFPATRSTLTFDERMVERSPLTPPPPPCLDLPLGCTDASTSHGCSCSALHFSSHHYGPPLAARTADVWRPRISERRRL